MNNEVHPKKLQFFWGVYTPHPPPTVVPLLGVPIKQLFYGGLIKGEGFLKCYDIKKASP